MSEGKGKCRGSYTKFMPEQQAAIRKYTSLHGNQVAIWHFSMQLEVELKLGYFCSDLENKAPVASANKVR